MSSRAAMQPVSGTFELRWQWHRGEAGLPARPRANGKPSAVTLDGAASAPALTAGPEPATARARPRLDEGSPGP